MPDLTLPDTIDLYRLMRLNRSLEERLVNLYRQGKIVGGLYRSLGQEATSVGSARALEEGDVLGPLIRNLGSVLVMGYTPREILTQHLARAASPSGGKEGNLHFGRPERGVVSSISMLGALVPVMAGIALAARMQRRRTVAMTYIGDGGTSTGAFHEGVNFAAVQKLPLVVIAENNGWAYSTPFRKQTAAKSLADRAPAYGIPGVSVDGNDVIAVRDTVEQALAKARSGEGATLIEALTYRLGDHTTADDASRYRDDAAVAEHWKDEPVGRLRRHLTQLGAWTRDDEERLLADCRVRVEQAVADYLAMPPEGPAAMFDHVYAALPDDLVEQRAAAIQGDGDA